MPDADAPSQAKRKPNFSPYLPLPAILRGRFSHCNETYCFRITDPVSENGSINLPYGEYPVGRRYLTVSLGEPFEGNAYKLIAAIIRP